MRIYPFTKKAEQSKADRVMSRVAPDLITAVKNLNEDDIKKLFNGFIPLDFLSLVQKVNPRVLTRALQSTIKKALNSKVKYKKWIEELRLDEDEAVNQVYTYILNDNPKNMGALTQIIEDGSYGTKYRPYNTDSKTKDKAATTVRNVGGLGVPTCPNQLKSNITYPLWTISTQEGDIRIEDGVDKNDRCNYEEPLGEMPQDQFETLESSREGLSENQIRSLDSGDLELVYKEGEASLRCTFHAKLNRFKPFLTSQAVGAITSVLSPERRRMGRGGAYWAEQMNRHKELELKEKSEEGLSQLEQEELKKIKKYLRKKQKDLVGKEQSLDAPFQGAEGDGKTLHEIEKGQEADLGTAAYSADEARSIRIDLEKKAGEQEIAILQNVAKKVSLVSLVKNIGTLQTLSSKSLKKKELDEETKRESLKISQKYLGKDDETPNTCNTCGAELGNTAFRCMHADQMKSVSLSSYQDKDSVSGIEEEIKRLDPHAQKHYSASGLSSAFNNVYSGIEIEEDDLDLDLGDFQSFEDNTPTEKLDNKTLRNRLEGALTEEQLKAYHGTDVNSHLEVTEEDALKVEQHAGYIQKIITNILLQDDDEQTLEKMLGSLVEYNFMEQENA